MKVFSIYMIGKTIYPMQMNETGSLSYIIHKNKLD